MQIAIAVERTAPCLRGAFVELFILCAAGAATAADALATSEERALKAPDRFKECDTCPEMVVVPAGAFTMGSPGKEEGPLAP